MLVQGDDKFIGQFQTTMRKIIMNGPKRKYRIINEDKMRTSERYRNSGQPDALRCSLLAQCGYSLSRCVCSVLSSLARARRHGVLPRGGRVHAGERH